MKKDIISNDIHTNVVYKTLSMMMCLPDDVIKKVYRATGDYGLITLSRCCIFFKASGYTLLSIKDLEYLKSFDDEKNTAQVFDFLIRKHYLSFKNNYYYIGTLNNFIGFEYAPPRAIVARFMSKGARKFDHSLLDSKRIERCLIDTINEGKQPLPPYLRKRIDRCLYKYKGDDLSTGVKIVSMYLRHSTNMIGMLSDINILSNVLRLKEGEFRQRMNNLGIRTVDNDSYVFYDSEQRLHHGLSAVPSDIEIEEARHNYDRRVMFMDKYNY